MLVSPGSTLLALKLDVKIREKGSGRERRVVQMEGFQRFDGDDDVYTFELSKPMGADEQLVVEAENTDPNYTYDYRVNSEVDYRAGKVNALYNSVKGVFN